MPLPENHHLSVLVHVQGYGIPTHALAPTVVGYCSLLLVLVLQPSCMDIIMLEYDDVVGTGRLPLPNVRT
jgi:hypothetical protein